MLAAFGHARDSGRAVYVAQSDGIEQLPQLISLPCTRFLLLLAYALGRKPARLSDALGELLTADASICVLGALVVSTCTTRWTTLFWNGNLRAAPKKQL